MAFEGLPELLPKKNALADFMVYAAIGIAWWGSLMARATKGLSLFYRKLADLRPYARNARTHSAKQIVKIEGSLLRFGWAAPLGIAGDDILVGHARHLAASNLRDRGRVIPRNADPDYAPTVDLSALSDVERRAYILADNQLATDAGWANDHLSFEVGALKMAGFDLALTGFSPLQIGAILGKAEGTGAAVLSDRMQYQIVIDCDSEADQAAMLERLRGQSVRCKPLIL